MNIDQYEGLISKLDEIIERMPMPPTPPMPPVGFPIPSSDPTSSDPAWWRGGVVARSSIFGARKALETMLKVAQDWAEINFQNGKGMGHRDVQPAERQQFILGDIRNMINDVAQELGIDDFNPEKGNHA